MVNFGSWTLRWRGLDSNFQYAEAVKLVVAAFSCADCLGRVGVLRFRPPRFERQAKGLQTPCWREPDSNHRSRSCERSLGCCRREMPDR